MNLYDIIPDNFFSPLVSSNKRIYLKALFALHKRFVFEWRIKKDELVYVLADELANDADLFAFDEEGMEADRSYSGFAHMLLRKLEATGWIEYEYGETDFEQYLIIPEYAISVLQTLQAIVEGESIEYNSYVYSTYSSLKTAEDSNDNHYHALITAFNSTKELIEKLKILLNNIKRYQKRLTDHKEVRELIREHFDDFKAGISDQIYHPLKTFDSVPRFKTPILKILNSWLMDDAIIETIQREGQKRGRFQEAAYSEVILMISEIIDIYEKLNESLDMIDAKHAAYTRAAVERVEFMINEDGSTRNLLFSILQNTDRLDEDSFEIPLSSALNLTEESLFVRKKQTVREPGEILTLQEPSDAGKLEREMAEISAMLDSAFSRQRIFEYMESLLQERSQVSVEEIPVKDDQDFIRLILGSLQHDDRKAPYTIRYKEGQIAKYGYRLPKLTVRRKGK